ncbi:tyrosine-type recombinase/integrase [Salinibacter grassmerensis]|uniref:tyrosine-type recombinase/integrase n=1 Tax=Salinibacter grassmerensis TaxID=3040353 RepID=UPI0021E6EB0C|nr:tyrosine-type recombinase/integrase [Salinibacter grassmerensis]
MSGIQRESDHTTKEAPPLLTRHVQDIVDALRSVESSEADRIRARRDVAIILLGYAGALRRSEIASVDAGHLTDRDDGYALLVPESKTDQPGSGQYVGILRAGSEYCPCRALDRWIATSGIDEGAVFRGVHWSGSIMDRISPQTVHRIVQHGAEAAGLSVSPTGHSLRAGHITQATINDVPDGTIRSQSRHEDPSTFYGYQRVHKALEKSSSGQLGL